MYNKRIWLNDEKSPSTGNAVAYAGNITRCDGKKEETMFLSIADCNVSARLHKSQDDTNQDFINKMKKLRNFIDDFIKYLENENKTEP